MSSFNEQGDVLLMKWKDNVSNTKVKEEVIIAVLGIILLVGVISDYLVSTGCVLIEVKDLTNASLVFLQIQATITTLIITIIALLSGSISDSYMGIPVSMFYLEIRPVYLKQKRVILIEFVSLAISLCAHLLGMYNFVIVNFLVSLVLILVSAFEIYEVFNGKKTTLEEIESYVQFLIDGGENLSKHGRALIYDWKNIIQGQPESDFDKYSKVFFDIIDSMLSGDGIINEINSLAEDMSLFLLMNEYKNCRVKGIRFIAEFYDRVWLWIINNKDKAKMIREPISLISRVEREWCHALDSIEAETIEQADIRFDSFSETIIRVSSWIGYSEDYKSIEVESVFIIGRTIGRYVNKQKKRGNIVDKAYWQRIITDKYVKYAYNIPEEAKLFYGESLALRDFNVCYGFLLSGQMEYIKDGVFLDGIKNTYKVDNQQLVLRVMLIHCYMYYIAFREKEECIDKNIQESLKEILLCNDVVNAVLNFYSRVSKNSDLVNEQIERKMEEIMQRYELFPEHSNVKVIIIEGVVRDYFLYVALIIERYSLKRDFLEKALNTQKYYMYLTDSNYVTLRNRISEMHSLFGLIKEKQEATLKKTDEFLFPFVKEMKQKYKMYSLEEASIVQEEYDSKGVQNKTTSYLKNLIEKKINDTISDFDKYIDKSKTYENVCIYSLKDYTKGIGDDYRGGYSENAVAFFISWIIKELSAEFGLKKIIRDECFETDNDLRNYLTNHKYEILLGSQYAFGATDYMAFSKHNDFLNSIRCKFVLGGNEGVALKNNALYVKLNNVAVKITSPVLEDMGVQKNKETGLYKYSPIQGIELDFEENELQGFLHDERKIVEVYINVTIGFNNEDENGIIITRLFE